MMMMMICSALLLLLLLTAITLYRLSNYQLPVHGPYQLLPQRPGKPFRKISTLTVPYTVAFCHL